MGKTGHPIIPAHRQKYFRAQHTHFRRWTAAPFLGIGRQISQGESNSSEFVSLTAISLSLII